MTAGDVGEFHREGFARHRDLAFEDEHGAEANDGMGQAIGLADLGESLAIDARQHDDEIDVGGLAEPPLRGRAEEHEGDGVLGEDPLCRLAKSG